MIRRLSLALGLASSLAVFAAACGSPTTPTSAASIEGAWSSTTTTTAQDTCMNFRWTAVSAGDTATGVFTATCNSTLNVSGTATATLSAGVFGWTATATGTLNGGTFVCDVSLAGTATLDTHGRLNVPFTGTTCVSAVSGTEVLGR